ncbi:hypothetical protein BZG36_01813 [Bifiguratus adelaidae]|uniref:Dethiobiotin synthase n=1 Tax=Bifiguratus adelaidae TaxID=1938954 RepID=A0A261Y2I5_9FUNG|nr:hypothetical protein BZG36_01813 [Bifiguratus adelaidae]
MAYFHPTRAFQIYQIFAANTDVGKTITSTALVKAASVLTSRRGGVVHYVKPIQTGYPRDSDARHVKTFNPSVVSETLYTYPDAVSPHAATRQPEADNEVLSRTQNYIARCAEQVLRDGKTGTMFLETAGGVHSPVMSGTSQADFYRPLRLPTLLVGDSRLGGISTTMTSFESLHIRGYDIPGLLLFKDERWNNHDYLSKSLGKEYKTRLCVIPPPPAPHKDADQDLESMRKYYDSVEEHVVPFMEMMEQWHTERFDRLASMPEKTQAHIWWPFTQHQRIKNVTVVDSAYNDYFMTYNTPQGDTNTKGELKAKELFDACASWWTQGLGHANPKLTLAAANAAGRYGHVMFPENTNEPALALTEELLAGVGKGWADRVFISDNGSTAMEVAFKMAHKTVRHRYGGDKQLGVIGLHGSYHGDTIGAMDACSPNVFNQQVDWYEPKGYWFTPPSVQMKKGKMMVTVPEGVASTSATQVDLGSLQDVFDVSRAIKGEGLYKAYKEHISSELDRAVKQGQQFGALLMEPVLMGSGGMIFVDPLFQRTLVEVVRESGIFDKVSRSDGSGWRGLPVIFDEVFTGFYRLGAQSAAQLLGVQPDIASYAKLLTGGLLPLAVTLSRSDIFAAFLSNEKPDCLLHGHSYTAHPTGCAVAYKTISELSKLKDSQEWAAARRDWNASKGTASSWCMWDRQVVEHISHMSNVEGVVSLGSVLAVELKDPNRGYSSFLSQGLIDQFRHQANRHNVNIFARPLGNVVYLMCSQISTRHGLSKIEDILVDALTNYQ